MKEKSSPVLKRVSLKRTRRWGSDSFKSLELVSLVVQQYSLPKPPRSRTLCVYFYCRRISVETDIMKVLSGRVLPLTSIDRLYSCSQRILTRDPQLDKRLRPHSGHRRMAHLNCPTVSKVSHCLGCLALGTARQTGQMGQKKHTAETVCL